jgi:hypothetical protein
VTTPATIRSITFSKENEQRIRTVIASAASIAGNLQQEGWKKIFEDAESLAGRLQDRYDELSKK